MARPVGRAVVKIIVLTISMSAVLHRLQNFELDIDIVNKSETKTKKDRQISILNCLVVPETETCAILTNWGYIIHSVPKYNEGSEAAVKCK